MTLKTLSFCTVMKLVASLIEQTAWCDNGSRLPRTSINKYLHTTNNWPQYKVQLLSQITCFNYLLEIQSLFRLNSFSRAVSTPLILLSNAGGLTACSNSTQSAGNVSMLKQISTIWLTRHEILLQ